jgi:hypothetical protein
MAGEATLNHILLNDHDQPIDAILPASDSGRDRWLGSGRPDWRQILGVLLILGGLGAVIGSWVGVSGSANTGSQLSYMTSGGLGGMGLIAIGVLLLVSFEHTRDRLTLMALGAQMSQVEEALLGELADVRDSLRVTQAARMGDSRVSR